MPVLSFKDNPVTYSGSSWLLYLLHYFFHFSSATSILSFPLIPFSYLINTQTSSVLNKKIKNLKINNQISLVLASPLSVVLLPYFSFSLLMFSPSFAFTSPLPTDSPGPSNLASICPLHGGKWLTNHPTLWTVFSPDFTGHVCVIVYACVFYDIVILSFFWFLESFQSTSWTSLPPLKY